MSHDLPKLPEPLEKMIDKVLAYKPKTAKAKVAKKRKYIKRASQSTKTNA
jgi:hypothetical protein